MAVLRLILSTFRKMSDSETIELACLGRPFQLGMLYDCRRDRLIPGKNISKISISLIICITKHDMLCQSH